MNQDRTIAFLSAGANYGLAGSPVERIETHGSIVFLIADRAYKLKRAIAFSALDYRTVALREAACRREVALNRRTAPALYIGVRAIRRRSDGTLGFDGDGEAVDWVVVMRRFPQADLFDRLADSGRLTPRLASALADEIARFHAAAETTGLYGGATGLYRAIEHNLHDQRTVESVLTWEAIDRLYRRSLAALDGVAALLDDRRARGRVRVCHGDLRLANICLYEGRPTLFDAIEFADELNGVDVLYDLAFLLMDLEQRGMHGLSNSVFNRYLDVTGDSGGLPALPLMASIRAGTRAYAVAASSQRKTERAEVQRQMAHAHALMNLAASLFEPASPRLVVLDGGAAADRDTLAADLACRFKPAPGARIVGANAAEISAAIAGGYSAVVVAPPPAMPAPAVGLWLGDARDAPNGWHVLDRARGMAASTEAARRLAGVAASPHG